MNASRIHSLDALRAFALLLGVVFHSGLVYVLPPGIWAIGTTQPNQLLGWFTFFTHSFRMELFFLLAGFFAAMAVQKRGVQAFLANRARRIVLVFALLLYPMKFLLASLWIIAGRKTGWLVLPPEFAATPWWKMALGAIASERLPSMQLTHLWFLYYLAAITGAFLLARFVAGLVVKTPQPRLNRLFHRIIAHPVAPLFLALAATPIIAAMDMPGVDTPDQSLLPHLPVLVLYSGLFAFGWWLFANQELLGRFAKHWHWMLIIGLVVSLPASALAGMLFNPATIKGASVAVIKWWSSLGTGLVMMFSVFGFLGLFHRYVSRPARWIRMLADASYFIYLAHLPALVALQIAIVQWKLPWYLELPLVNVVCVAGLLAAYNFASRKNRTVRTFETPSPVPARPA